MPHMALPIRPLCSLRRQPPCQGLSLGTPKAEPRLTGGEFSLCCPQCKTRRLLLPASFVLQEPRFYPSCWVTSTWPLPPGCWGKRRNGRKAISLEEEVQKLHGYLHLFPQGTNLVTWPHLASRDAVDGWPWA